MARQGDRKDTRDHELDALRQRVTRLEANLRNVAAGLSAAVGPAFFRSLVDYLARALNADYAFVGEVTGTRKDQVRTLAAWADGKSASNFTYTLQDTPCENVVRQALCAYPRGVRARFPRDTLLEKMQVEAYVATPLVDASGRTVGLIAVMRRRPMENVELASSTLQIFAARAAVELERTRAEEALRLTVEGTSAKTGGDFFRSLVRHLAGALGVRYGFITELLDAERGRMRLLSFWTGTEHGSSFEYNVKGTPCESIFRGQLTFYGRDVQNLFPDDDKLRELNVESYLAIPLFDPEGAPLGHMGVMHDEPMAESREAEWILRIFAARAASELGRKRSEDARQQLQERMQQAQKLESIGVLASGVAHDFNNLLMGILGNSGLALMRLAADSPARPLVQQIESASARAVELTEQLLNYAGAGGATPRRPIDLSGLVADTAGLMRTSLGGGAALTFRLAEELPAIDADPIQIRQVIMNLITNAAEALPEGRGAVTVATGLRTATRRLLDRNVLREPLPAGDYVFLEVSDTGAGIDAATQPRIFDPFFTTKATGRGLGLAALLGIVRSHHGAIILDSKPQRGTTFCVLLPASRRPAEAAAQVSDGDTAAETVQPEAAGAATILIADDEPVVREVVRTVLEQSRYRVLTAAGGRECLECFRAHADEVSCVLVDLSMPDMTGTDVAKRLKRMRPDLKIILSSGYPWEDAVRRYGVVADTLFIQKPYRPREILQVLDRVLCH